MTTLPKQPTPTGSARPPQGELCCCVLLRELTSAYEGGNLWTKQDKRDKPATPTGPLKQASDQTSNAGSRPNPQALDAAREFVRDRLSKSSIRRVAAESGIDKGVIAKFADGATPHPRNAQALVEYHRLSAPAETEGTPNAPWRPDPLALDAAREFVRNRLSKSSIRRVAAESGISRGVIAKFADGATPHPLNAHALVEFHLRSGKDDGAPDPQALHAAREFVRVRVRNSSIRRVAAESGIGKGVIARFADGATPHPRYSQALVEYHIRAEAEETHRVPDEKLREFYSEEYRRVRSLRRVAKAVDVTYGTLQGFLEGVKATQPAVRHKLAAHYLAREGRLSEPKSRPSSSPARGSASRPRGRAGRAPSPRSARVGPPPPALGEAREFIRGCVNASSVVRVAKDVGPPVTHKVIEKFLAGSVPRPANAEALIAFHARGGLPRMGEAGECNDTPAECNDTPDEELEAVRELVRSREQREPLRIIAEETGIARNTLAKFSRGSTPVAENRQKLLRWYNALPPEARVVQPAPTPPEEEAEPAVDFVRQLVAQRQEQIGMYLLGDELGVSTTPIRDFVAGSPPTHRTWEKLVAWYRVRKAAGLAVLHPKLSKEIRFQPPGDTPCRAAMGILMDAFPERERRAVRQRVLEVMAAKHQNAGRDLPEWIKDLLKEPDPPRWYGTRTGLASRVTGLT